MGAAAGDEVYAGVHILRRKALFILAGRAVDGKIGRGGVIDAAGDGKAGFHALVLRNVQGSNERLFVLVYADVSVLGLLSCGKGGAAGAGVGYQPVRAVSTGIAGNGHLVDVELSAVGNPAHGPLRKAGTVADEEDDVLHLLRFGLLHGNGLVRGLHGVLVVLGEAVGCIF